MIASTFYSLALCRGPEMIFLLKNLQVSIRIMLKIARIQRKASGCSVLIKKAHKRRERVGERRRNSTFRERK